jgi:hypothetical protein
MPIRSQMASQAIHQIYLPSQNTYPSGRSGEGYEPDFVVETRTHSLILEVKARNEVDDPIVQAKAAAASKWCKTPTSMSRRPKPNLGSML